MLWLVPFFAAVMADVSVRPLGLKDALFVRLLMEHKHACCSLQVLSLGTTANPPYAI
jgi:hypothetical protein